MPIAPLAAAVAATFNLVCSGTVETNSFNKKEVEPFSYAFRVDLDKKVYCEEECKVTHPIDTINNVAIIFQDKNDDSLSGRETILTAANRETGEFTGLVSSSSRTIGPMATMTRRHTGKCERQPFTGFPAPPVTKF